ncbi:MAG: hypothetical protein ACPHRO_00845 [Nannocystaceae bacterium]
MRLAPLVLLCSLVSASSCLVELKRSISCGDGFVDLDAGEQCDPRDISRAHESACAGVGFPLGKALCDPNTCQILANADVCAVCNDGIAAGGEDCDQDDFNGAKCPGNSGEILCSQTCTLDYSNCEACGNGLSDPGEECEYKVFCEEDADCLGVGGVCDLLTGRCLPSEDALVAPIPCSSLKPPPGLDAYGDGTVNFADCSQSCTYGRTDCSGCGNGELDGSYEDLDRFGNLVPFPSEVCDGDLAKVADIVEHCRFTCTGGLPTSLDLVCEFTCEDDCGGFEEPNFEDFVEPDPSCCILADSPCDQSGEFPCCWKIDNPGAVEDGCQPNNTCM